MWSRKNYATVSPNSTVPFSGRKAMGNPPPLPSAKSRKPQRLFETSPRGTRIFISNDVSDMVVMRCETVWPVQGSGESGNEKDGRLLESARNFSSSRTGLIRRFPSFPMESSLGKHMTVLPLRLGSSPPSHAHITLRPSGVSTLSGANKSEPVHALSQEIP